MKKRMQQGFILELALRIRLGNGFSLGEQQEKLEQLCKYKGDEVYSNGKNPFGVKGQMLHAYKLEFKHPRTDQTMFFEAPLPTYFQEVLSKLNSKSNY